MINVRDARAARGGAEDHDVLGRGAGDTELEVNVTAGIADDQLADGIHGELRPLGRVQEHGEIDCGALAIDLYEERAASERPALSQIGSAGEVRPAGYPGLALRLGEFAPVAGDTAHRHAGAHLGKGGWVLGDDVVAFDLAIAALEADRIAVFAGLWGGTCLHNLCKIGLAAAPIVSRAQATGGLPIAPASPMTDDSINGSKSASLFRNRRRKRAYLATTTTRRKAFTRESDGESGAAETPSFRPRLPPGTRNYITREGVDRLKQRLKYLLEKKHALASASAAWTAMEAEQRKIESAIRRL